MGARHLIAREAEPATVVVVLLNAVEVYSRPPVSGPNLSGGSGEAIPGSIQAGLFRRGRRDGIGSSVRFRGPFGFVAIVSVGDGSFEVGHGRLASGGA